METMRTLSITMLLAGCGLHAFDPDTSNEHKIKMGSFVLIDDYRGRNHVDNDPRLHNRETGGVVNEHNGVNENIVDEESTSFSHSGSGYLSESFSSDISQNDRDEEGRNDAAGSSESEETVPEEEPEIERNEPTQTQLPNNAQQGLQQVQTATVIEHKRSVLPVIIGTSAAVGLGYAVYKYVTADKNEKIEKEKIKESKVKAIRKR